MVVREVLVAGGILLVGYGVYAVSCRIRRRWLSARLKEQVNMSTLYPHTFSRVVFRLHLFKSVYAVVQVQSPRLVALRDHDSLCQESVSIFRMTCMQRVLRTGN